MYEMMRREGGGRDMNFLVIPEEGRMERLGGRSAQINEDEQAGDGMRRSKGGEEEEGGGSREKYQESPSGERDSDDGEQGGHLRMTAPRSGSRRKSRTGRGSRKRRDERRRQQRLQQLINQKQQAAGNTGTAEEGAGHLSVLLNYATIIDNDDYRPDEKRGESWSPSLKSTRSDTAEYELSYARSLDAIPSSPSPLDYDNLSIDSFSDDTRSLGQEDFYSPYGHGESFLNSPFTDSTSELSSPIFGAQSETFPNFPLDIPPLDAAPLGVPSLDVTPRGSVQNVSKVVVTVTLDHHGFIDLVDRCFTDMEKRICNHISHAEFRYCCGLLLYHRLLKIEHNLLGLRKDYESWFTDFERCLGSNIMVPVNVWKYLSCLGEVQDQHGNTYVPAIELPPARNKGHWEREGPQGDSFLAMGIITSEIADQIDGLPSGTNYGIVGHPRRTSLVAGIPCRKMQSQRRNVLKHRLHSPIIRGGNGWRSQLQWGVFSEETWSDFQNLMRKTGNLVTQYNKHDCLCKGDLAMLIVSIPTVHKVGEYETQARVVVPPDISPVSHESVVVGRQIRTMRYVPIHLTFNNCVDHVGWSMNQRRKHIKQHFIFESEEQRKPKTVALENADLRPVDYPDNLEILHRELAQYSITPNYKV